MSISLNADDCLIINRNTIVALFITGDIITVLAQIAGTALQATFGELINIGVKVGFLFPPFFKGFVKSSH